MHTSTKTRTRGSFKTLVCAVSAAGLLAACQTTTQKLEEKPIDIAETHIVFPGSLLKRDDFEIKKATVQTSGSFRHEKIYFTNGYIKYARYFRGGMSSISEYNFENGIKNAFGDIEMQGDTNVMRAEMGQIFYNDFKTPDGDTCMAMQSNQGRKLRFANGTGHQGIITGLYCLKGDHPDLQENVVAWMKEIELKPF